MAEDARLFVLATLDRLGEAHGYEVVRESVQVRAEEWTLVSHSVLYAALHRAETDGLIEPVRTEQVGNRPPRTVYRLTPLGQQALEQSRQNAWLTTGLSPDPFDLALSVSNGSTDTEALRAAITARLDAYVTGMNTLRDELVQRRNQLEPAASAVFEHAILRHEAEITWHRRLLKQVDGLTTERAAAQPG